MKSIEIIKKALNNINAQLPKKNKIILSSNSQIFGNKSKLDSFAVVNLFLEIENITKEIKKKKINLLNEDIFANSSNIQYTLKDLEKDLNHKIKKK